ncbi:MAG: hypothetical protein GX089_04485 [Fibrobacter sp.]|jgi:hypothetical protein|nr:hypothetical protein [Fibrobacter sp.]
MAQQCKGITRAGQRCKNSRNLTDGFCHLHVSQNTALSTGETPQNDTVPRLHVQNPPRRSSLKGVISMAAVVVTGLVFMHLFRKKTAH